MTAEERFKGDADLFGINRELSYSRKDVLMLMTRAYNMAIADAAERATIKFIANGYPTVDKQSILNLKLTER